MSEEETGRPSLRKLGIPARRAVSVAPEDLVHIEPLNESGLPQVIRPAVPGVSLAGWAEGNRDLISQSARQVWRLALSQLRDPSGRGL